MNPNALSHSTTLTTYSLFGWKDNALQKAMDADGCFAANCGGLKGQDIATANKCQIKKTVTENVDGCKSISPRNR
jgi:hypothetical protein